MAETVIVNADVAVEIKLEIGGPADDAPRAC
jgi:hypothetical protein